MKKIILFFILIGFAQEKTTLNGCVSWNKKGISGVSFAMINKPYSNVTDSLGNYEIQNLSPESYKVQVTASGFETIKKSI